MGVDHQVSRSMRRETLMAHDGGVLLLRLFKPNRFTSKVTMASSISMVERSASRSGRRTSRSAEGILLADFFARGRWRPPVGLREKGDTLLLFCWVFSFEYREDGTFVL